MLNINCEVDVKGTPEGYRQVIIEFQWPGCGCVHKVETAPIDSLLDDQDLVYEEMRKIDESMKKNPYCRHCLHNFNDSLIGAA